MKTIKVEEDQATFENYVERAIKENANIVVWQYNSHAAKRMIYNATLLQYSLEEQKMDFIAQGNKNFDFGNGVIYFYVETDQFIFKTDQISIQTNLLTVKMPEEIKFLDQNDADQLKRVLFQIDKNFGATNQLSGGSAQSKKGPYSADYAESQEHVPYEFETNEKGKKSINYDRDNAEDSQLVAGIDVTEAQNLEFVQSQSESDREIFEEQLNRFVSLSDEDAMYASKREAPRTRAESGKQITVTKHSNVDARSTHSLFDLSTCGTAFIAFSESEYEIGEILHVLAFDTKRFGRPMYVEVVNIRQADELGIQFKIGCRFLADEELSEFNLE